MQRTAALRQPPQLIVRALDATVRGLDETARKDGVHTLQQGPADALREGEHGERRGKGRAPL